MANYEQLKPFYPKDMGTKKGWCLQNVAKGFHIYPSPNPSGSAVADMNTNKRKGTLHSGVRDIPTNCAVPVYQDTLSKNEHILVYDKGVWYSDGKKVNKPGNIFGWGEWCNGYQIVKKGAAKGFLPAKGYWARYDKDERVAKLSTFMYKTFPAYTNKKALGNVYGDYLWKSIKQFQKNVGLYPDGCVGKLTYAQLQKYGFRWP